MTRKQRQQSAKTVSMQSALEKFVENPCKLSTSQTEALLSDLCIRLGWCLAPYAWDRVMADPPSDPQAFAELVVKLDGNGVEDPALLRPVLELVLKTFERHARADADE